VDCEIEPAERKNNLGYNFHLVTKNNSILRLNCTTSTLLLEDQLGMKGEMRELNDSQ
jgi:hypothetical protein